MLTQWIKQLLSVPAPVSARDYLGALPTLETERLILRPVKMSDADDLFSYCRDPEVSQYCLWEPHESLSDTRAYIRWMKQQYRLCLPSSYAVVLKASGHVIGTAGFMALQDENACAEIGYSFSREHWGHGYATETLRSLLQLSFTKMGLHRVEALYDTDNPASGRVMEKNGMKQEGILRQKILNRRQWRDVVLCSILADEWHNASASDHK